MTLGIDPLIQSEQNAGGGGWGTSSVGKERVHQLRAQLTDMLYYRDLSAYNNTYLTKLLLLLLSSSIQ